MKKIIFLDVVTGRIKMLYDEAEAKGQIEVMEVLEDLLKYLSMFS